MTKRRVLTTADLSDQIGMTGQRPFLHCPQCLARYSANRGDYFWKRPNEPFDCDACEIPLELVIEHVTFERIK
jgi:hypothetical protein